MVAEDAFFVPKLQSALEFGHTLLVVDCMHRQIYLAAPNVQQHGGVPASSDSSTSSTGSLQNLPPPMIGGGAAPGATAAAAKHHVISALPCAITFVEECRSLWDATRASAATSSQVGSQAAAAGADVLRSIVELSPVLRSMAEAEFTQLLLRQNESKDEQYPPERAATAAASLTPPRGAAADAYGSSSVGASATGDLGGAGRVFSPLRMRSQLSTLQQQQHTGSSFSTANALMLAGSAPGGPSAASSSLAATAGGGEGREKSSRAAPASKHVFDQKLVGSAFGVPEPQPVASKIKGAMKPTVSGGLAAQQQQQQQQFLPTLMNSFLSNDVMFALRI
jgi:hypothetical protein